MNGEYPKRMSPLTTLADNKNSSYSKARLQIADGLFLFSTLFGEARFEQELVVLLAEAALTIEPSSLSVKMVRTKSTILCNQLHSIRLMLWSGKKNQSSKSRPIGLSAPRYSFSSSSRSFSISSSTETDGTPRLG